MKTKKSNKGFTLVELLVVIAIIGILAVVAVPALFKNIEKGKVADLEADISAIKSSVLSFYANESAYPESGTIIDGKVDSKDTDHSKKIESEIEGLGFPFGNDYILQNVSGKLHILIEGEKLSQSAIDKIENDLNTTVNGSASAKRVSIVLIDSNI